MLREDMSVRDLMVATDEMLDMEARGDRAAGRCAEAERKVDMAPLGSIVSAPLRSACFALRSSVTFAAVTSFRSSSECLRLVVLGAALRKGSVAAQRTIFTGMSASSPCDDGVAKPGRVGNGETYIPTSSRSKAGVVGRLASWTVSRREAMFTVELREGPFISSGGASGSSVASSSGTGNLDAGAGDELWTTMAGVDAVSGRLDKARREFRRERERVSVGGGDFKRGETGQWGVLSPELEAEAVFWTARGTRDGSGVELAAWCES